jgi:AcrR family transcriptional regulator
MSETARSNAVVARRPPRVLRLPHGQGRRALLEAVVRVAARKGFDGLTYRAVAAEAGVTHGLVHYHFGTREAMVAEALRWAVQEAIAGAQVLSQGDGVDGFAAGLAELVRDQRDAQAFQHEVKLAAGRLDDLRPDVERLYDDYFAAVTRTLEEAGIEPTRARVRLFFAALQGLVGQQLFFGDPAATGEAVEELRSLLRLLQAQQST